MPVANAAALAFLLGRRSSPAKTLTAPYPDRAALEPILTAALRSPDHGKLEPWRLVVLRGAALGRLGALAAERGRALDKPAPEIEKAQLTWQGAGLVVAVISAPVPSAKIPQIEQVYSAGAVCLSLLNAALAAGWGANWITGWVVYDAVFLEKGLGLSPGESVAGLVHIGTASVALDDRPRPDPAARVSWVEA